MKESEGGLSEGAFRDPRVRCLFLAGAGGKWASTSGSLPLSEWKRTVKFFPSLMLTSLS